MTIVDCKRCAKCKEMLPVTEFGVGKRWKDGLFPYCRPCKRECDQRDRVKHREVRTAAAAARYAANPEPAKARSRKRYEENPDAWKAASLKWAKNNPEKRKAAYTAWQQRNMHTIVRENVRRRYATRKGAVAIKFSKAQLEQRMAFYGNRCWVCRGPREAVDHVKPLTKGGAHMLCNLRPICWSCNSRKGNAWPFPLK